MQYFEKKYPYKWDPKWNVRFLKKNDYERNSDIRNRRRNTSWSANCGGTLWLSLNQIATLFERDKSLISRHLKSIYKEGELIREATVAKNATVQSEGNREVERTIEYYNLDAILSTGYRVNSKRGTQFRQWATQRLKEHLI